MHGGGFKHNETLDYPTAAQGGKGNKLFYLYINLAYLGGCLFVSNKRQNGWIDQAQIYHVTTGKVYEW